MSIDIRELDASLTLRFLSSEEKQAVVRLMELVIDEVRKSQGAQLAALQTRIETLETAANKAIELLPRYTNDKPQSNSIRARIELEKVLKGNQ